ncbi:hypothetical protein [Lacibacter cauensis]|nr:hypothetical protein [Lacibacter cauensis]
MVIILFLFAMTTSVFVQVNERKVSWRLIKAKEEVNIVLRELEKSGIDLSENFKNAAYFLKVDLLDNEQAKGPKKVKVSVIDYEGECFYSKISFIDLN